MNTIKGDNKKYIIELVTMVQQGSQEGIEELYKLMANKVYYFALKMVKNQEDAKDIMQESLIKAFEKINTLEQAEAFTTWVYRITSNQCKNFFIKNKRSDLISSDGLEDMEFADENEGVLPAEIMQREETSRLMKEMIDVLPEAQRSCIILFYFNELSVKEIAEVLECSEGTIKSRLNYGRKQIKDSVLKLEQKKNTKLYNFVPLGALLALLKVTSAEEVLAEETINMLSSSLMKQLSTAMIQNTSHAVGSEVVRQGIKKIILESATTKVIATMVVVATMALVPLIVLPNLGKPVEIIEEHNRVDKGVDDIEHEVIEHESTDYSALVTFNDSNIEEGIRKIINRPQGNLQVADLSNIDYLIIRGGYISAEDSTEAIWYSGESKFTVKDEETSKIYNHETKRVMDEDLEALGIYKTSSFISNLADLKQFPHLAKLTIYDLPDMYVEDYKVLNDIEGLDYLVICPDETHTVISNWPSLQPQSNLILYPKKE